MKSIKVCEYSRLRSFHDDLILQDQASDERSQDRWSSGSDSFETYRCLYNACDFDLILRLIFYTFFAI